MNAKHLLIPGILLSVWLGGPLAAQNPAPHETQQAKLLEMSQRLLELDAKNQQQAAAWATAAGVPLTQTLPGGGVLALQRIAPGIGPIFYLTSNVDAADSVSVDELYPGGSAGLNLEGAGMTVGAWDAGDVDAAHSDFFGRLVDMDGPTMISGHTTHVSGTLVGAGDGLDPRSRGMAYAAQLNSWNWENDTAEMAAAAAGGLLVSNHSYGIAAGWIYIGEPEPEQWWWVGGTADTDQEDPKFGFYDATAQLWDQVALDAPYYLIVKAGGNDRTDIGPAPGEQYTIVDEFDNKTVSTVPRPPDCYPLGYDCMPMNAVAKNVLTVGAVDDVIGGYAPLSGPGQVNMTSFSSWGPADDGRIKPDIVGNGEFLVSAWLTEGTSYPYAVASGTSMAAPNVTGSLLLLQEHYEDVNGPGVFMRSATLKALAIHTADEAGEYDGPDYAFGWGLLNAKKAAQVITEDGGDHHIIEGTLADGGTDTVPVTVSQADSQITATLVWMDPPGTPVPYSLDPPDLMLVNDLDLRVTDGGTTWLPWVLDPASPAAAATRGDNFRDNVEQVEATGLGAGIYTVEVSHKGSLLGGLGQDYALIVSVEPAPPTGSGLILDEDFAGHAGSLPPGWTLESYTNPVVNWAVRSPIPDGSRDDNLTGGSGEFAIADFGYITEGAASLRTPMLDLSLNTDAVLRFRSQYSYDTWESLNVDASTDGGFSWTPQWTFQGFNPFPTLVTLDLSAAIAGQPSVMLRFRFDSEFSYSGDYWQIDDVELEGFGAPPPPGDPPGMAAAPDPADGAVDVATTAVLSWTAGVDADSHDVYFGTIPVPGPGELQGNQPGTSFAPAMGYSTTYYWRIDEVNTHGTTMGPVWSFTTAAEPPPPPPAADMHLADMQGAGVEASKGRWEAVATITVEDAGGLPVSGVQVDGNWSNGANGAGSCTTDGGGQCDVAKQSLKNNVGSVDFTVTGLVLSGYTWDGAADEVPPTVTILKPAPNLLPNAVDDSFTTPVDTPLLENAMTNDDQGDFPATATSDGTSANGFTVTMATDGSFTYTPTGGFSGPDNFGYSIIDSNGDSSAATVNITVGGPPAVRSVTASTSQNKGNKIVTLNWSGFADANVTISRNTVPQATVDNALGTWQDNLGKKPAAGTYTYEVCEEGPSTGCASDSVSY